MLMLCGELATLIEGRQLAYTKSAVVQVYIAELMQPLLECMHKLSSDGTFVILAYYERSASAAQEFWSLLPQFFNAVKIPEASFGASAQPDNVGLFQLRKLRI